MKYKCGLYIGRFQPFHNGHKSIVDKMLKECEDIIIVVGSADKRGTAKNPFPSWERINMISAVYPNANFHLVPMPDRPTIGNDSGWGDYVMDYLASLNLYPDVIYQGNEIERNTWFKNFNIDIISIGRLSIPVSSTLIRSAILERDAEFIYKHCPQVIADYITHSIYWGKEFT